MPPKKKQRLQLSLPTDDSVLCNEIRLVEKLKKARSLLHAKMILDSLTTKAARVVYASYNVPSTIYETEYRIGNGADDASCNSGDDLSEDEVATIRRLKDLKDDPCCRNPKDRSVGGVPAKILATMEPIMARHPNPTKLSQIIPILELLFTFNFIDHRNNEPVNMEKWEKCGDYFCKIAGVPLASELLDPAYLLIRLAGGGPAPVGAVNALNAIPVGGPVGTALSQNPIPFPAAGTANATTLSSLFELGNKRDTGVAIAALRMWGAVQAPVVNLEILRFAPDPQGIEFF